MVHLCLHPLPESVHHRFALFLVKGRPFQGGEFPFLGLGLKAVNLPQAFDDLAGFLRKVLIHVDEVSSCVEKTVALKMGWATTRTIRAGVLSR